jgi:murein DD-endopeptidase MepM/ murein hydrolase activator NlpD
MAIGELSFLESCFRFLIELTIRATLVLSFAIAIAWILRMLTAAIRHMIWILAACAIIALPGLDSVLPDVNVALISGFETVMFPEIPAEEAADNARPPDETFTGSMRTTHFDGYTSHLAVVARVNDTNGSRTHGSGQGATAHLLAGIIIIWITGAVIMLMRITRSVIVARHVSKRASQVDDNTVSLFQKISQQCGFTANIPLLEHSDIPAPMITGLFSPRIILPAKRDNWNRETLRSILIHELSHIKRLDTVSHLLLQMVTAVIWFHPLAWFVLYCAAADREEACDDMVLARGVKPSDYAANLMIIAEFMKTRNLLLQASAEFTRGKHFKERIMAILADRQLQKTPGKITSVFLALFALLVVLSLAAFHPWETITQRKTVKEKADTPLAVSVDIVVKPLESTVLQGDPAGWLFASDGSIQSATVYFLGKSYSFAQSGDDFIAFTPVDLNTPPDTYEAEFVLLTHSGERLATSATITVEGSDHGTYKVPFDTSYGQPQTERDFIERAESLLTRTHQWNFPFSLPLEGRISSPFGTRHTFNDDSVEIHNGADIAAPEGSEVRATNAGTVVFAGKLQVAGNLVIIDHGGGIVSEYWHLKETSVQEGRKVGKDDVIGLCGSSGRSTGPHVHWVVKINGVACNPVKLAQLNW